MGFWMLLEIDIVQIASYPPKGFILLQGAGIALHRRCYHQGMVPLIRVLDVFEEKCLSLLLIGKVHHESLSILPRSQSLWTREQRNVV